MFKKELCKLLILVQYLRWFSFLLMFNKQYFRNKWRPSNLSNFLKYHWWHPTLPWRYEGLSQKKVVLRSRKPCTSCFLEQKTALKRSIGAITLDVSKTFLIIHDSLLWNTFFYGFFCSVKVAGLAAVLYYSSEDVRLLCNANAITWQIL